MSHANHAVVVQSWFDGETHHDKPTTLHVEAGRIASIAPGDHGHDLAKRGVTVQRGAFLMPGLIDAHVHLFLDGGQLEQAQRSAHLKQERDALAEAARKSARQSLAHGVTQVRDAGDKHGINNQVRAEALDASQRLARVRSGGLGVKRPKRYGAFMAHDVEDDEAIRASVAKLAQHNDEIKLILTGIIDFDAGAVTDEPQFDLESARLVVETARAHGRQTFAHCSGEKGLQIAAQAGIGSIEHGFFMTREVLAVMRDNQVAWTPTFCPVHFHWAQPEVIGWKSQTVGHLRRILDHHAEHLRLADEMGVPLLMGTDAGSQGVEHGKAMFEEIDRYLEAGLSLQNTLRAATANARRHFGAEHATLKTGASFEAVLLEESPFQRHQALHRPEKVWLG